MLLNYHWTLFIYLQITLTNQNLIYGEIKEWLHLGNVCCHPYFVFPFPCKSVMISEFKTAVLLSILICLKQFLAKKVIGWGWWNRAVRRKSGRKRRKIVAGGWRKCHSEELHTMYCWPNIRRIRSKRVMCVKQVASLEEMGNVYKIFTLKTSREGTIWSLGVSNALYDTSVWVSGIVCM